VLEEFPAPPGSAYPGARAGQTGSEPDQQRPYGQAAGSRPYGEDQRPGMALNSVTVCFLLAQSYAGTVLAVAVCLSVCC